MRNLFSSNLVIVSLMGVLLLFASAVGRVAATNMGGWLTPSSLAADRTSAAAPDRFAAVADWRGR